MACGFRKLMDVDLGSKVGFVSGLQIKKCDFYLALRSTCTTVDLGSKVGCVSGLQIKKCDFYLALRSTCTTFAPLKTRATGCSAVRLARLLWEQEVPGSNPGTPTYRH